MNARINPELFLGDSNRKLSDINNEANKARLLLDMNGNKNIHESLMCYESLKENPNLDQINKPGIYPLYNYQASMKDGTTKPISWGSVIVIPYKYGTNGSNGKDWRIQLIIGSIGWTDNIRIQILGRICSYYNGWEKWEVIK